MAWQGDNGDDSQRRDGGLIPGGGGIPAFSLTAPQPSALPLLIAVPHAGRAYPGTLLERMRNPGFAALKLEDRYVDNRLQLAAIALAVIAVLIQTFAAGVFPWLGLMLASTFCLYGFLRKTIAVGPTQGFFIEVCIIAIPLLLVQFWLVQNGQAHFGGNVKDTLLLMGCGVMTTTALVFFAASIKLLRYSTAGLLQYISPSLVFLTAVFIFKEPLDKWKLLSFVILWVGLAIYSYSALRDEKNRRREAEALA